VSCIVRLLRATLEDPVQSADIPIVVGVSAIMGDGSSV
jgi:hypothetical protein